MRKITRLFVFILLLSLVPFSVSGQERAEVNFFYSEVCPHCAAEKEFLKKLQSEHPKLEVNMYSVSSQEGKEKLLSLYEEYEVDQRKRGLVPATFIGDHCFVGYDNEAGVGQKIREAVEGTLEDCECVEGEGKTVDLPLVGKIEISDYSLPVLTVIMGILDGFNVCSLGALVLILGLVLSFRSRKKILVFGGLFVLVTAVVYGLLIVLWYKLFSLLSSYLRVMEVLIALLAIGGGVHFLREFVKFRKHGVTCESGGKQVGGRFLDNIKNGISNHDSKPWALVGSILLFAAVITIVEFPCSAAVPVVYAGVLADADLGPFVHLVYISAFVLLYMLDELLVFGAAVWKMSIWMTSDKFVTWVTLVEAVVLFGLGAFYLVGI